MTAPPQPVRWELIAVRDPRISPIETHDSHFHTIDGRRIVIPAGPREGEQTINGYRLCQRTRWRALMDALQPEGLPRMRIENGRLLALAEDLAIHPLDVAIVAAFGGDERAILAAARDMTAWSLPEAVSDPKLPRMTVIVEGGGPRIHVGTPWHFPEATTGPSFPKGFRRMGRRLAGSVDVAHRLRYLDGEFHLGAIDLPDSVVAELSGRALRDLVAIPEVAHLDLTILEARMERNTMLGTQLSVRVLDRDRWISAYR